MRPLLLDPLALASTRPHQLCIAKHLLVIKRLLLLHLCRIARPRVAAVAVLVVVLVTQEAAVERVGELRRDQGARLAAGDTHAGSTGVACLLQG